MKINCKKDYVLDSRTKNKKEMRLKQMLFTVSIYLYKSNFEIIKTLFQKASKNLPKLPQILVEVLRMEQKQMLFTVSKIVCKPNFAFCNRFYGKTIQKTYQFF